MTVPELERLRVLQQVHDGVRRQREAAVALGLSERQLRRLVRRLEEDGAVAVASKRRGKLPNNRVADEIREAVLERCRGDYRGFGPTFLAQTLAERDRIDVSREWLRALLVENDLWQSKRRKRNVQSTGASSARPALRRRSRPRLRRFVLRKSASTYAIRSQTNVRTLSTSCTSSGGKRGASSSSSARTPATTPPSRRCAVCGIASTAPNASKRSRRRSSGYAVLATPSRVSCGIFATSTRASSATARSLIGGGMVAKHSAIVGRRSRFAT